MRQIVSRQTLIFLLQALIVILCEAGNALVFQSLVVPSRLLSGGVVGTALLLNQLFSLPIGLQTMIYNIPIFWLGWRFLGRRFVVLSIIGVASFSIFMDNLHVPRVTNDLLLIAIFGGALGGIMDSTIIRTGGSTGGFDILGLIVSRRFGMSIGQVFLIFNGVIIALAAVFNNLELAMYTLIMLFVSTRTIDAFLTTTSRPVALIMSAKHEEIARRIHSDLRRGVTYLHGRGAYTDTPFEVIMCVLTRLELVELRRLVHELDPQAFTIILDASDVIGRFDRASALQRIFQ